jgi:hypothetical protein
MISFVLEPFGLSQPASHERGWKGETCVARSVREKESGMGKGNASGGEARAGDMGRDHLEVTLRRFRKEGLSPAV